MIDGNKCITCAMCAIVCPFDALRYHPIPSLPLQKAVAVKCDQCIDRQRNSKIPACVEACKVGALVFGEINEMIKSAGQNYAEKISLAVNDTEKLNENIPSHINNWRELNKKVQTINNR
jgi:carbon-monoxide dehydrogenase iron sulfur subunit